MIGGNRCAFDFGIRVASTSELLSKFRRFNSFRLEFFHIIGCGNKSGSILLTLCIRATIAVRATIIPKFKFCCEKNYIRLHHTNTFITRCFIYFKPRSFIKIINKALHSFFYFNNLFPF